jgi:formylglycine-generating enzyme required for sulfatase activity
MKRKLLPIVAMALSAAAYASSPTISGVTGSPAGEDRIFADTSFTYTLSGEPGIVTFYLTTNGVPVDCPYVNVTGDMNRLLQPGTHSFQWRNDIDWPGQTIRGADCRIVVKAWSTNSPPDYLVYNLSAPSESPRYYAKATDVPGGVTNIMYKTTHLVMRRIHAAGQTMVKGVESGDPAYISNFVKPCEVAFTRDFYIGIYELTIGQMLAAKPKTMSDNVVSSYRSVYGPDLKQEDEALMLEVSKDTELNLSRAAATTTPKWYWFGSGYLYPATGRSCASSLHMQKFRDATLNPTMFLPTSFQWEFACRAGTETRLYDGSNETNDTVVGELGWYAGNNKDDPDWWCNAESLDLTTDSNWYTNTAAHHFLPHVVGLKKPNAWGLYDMLGNIAESCIDNWVNNEPVSNADGTPVVDPTGPELDTSTGTWFNPACGGSLENQAKLLSSGYCDKRACNSSLAARGYRLVCDVEVYR